VDVLPVLLAACRSSPLEHDLVVVVRAEPREVRHYALAYGSAVTLLADGDGRLEARYLSGVRVRPSTVLIHGSGRVVTVVRGPDADGHVAALLDALVNRTAA
jgi:hypothetical protein